MNRSEAHDASDHLATGALGQTEALFQAVAHLGPAGAAIVVFPFLTQFVGAGVPFILLVCLGALLLTAWSVASLARHLPSAGGFFSYVSHGLGKRSGFFTVWAYFLYDPLVPTLSILVAAGILEQVFQDNLGVRVPWWATTLVLLGLVHVVTYVGIKQSARFNLVLGLSECVVLFALSLAIIVHVGRAGQSLEPFQVPAQAQQSLFLGFAFALVIFTGFESAVPLAEETANPRRTIPRTLILSLLLVGALWVFSAYAMVVGAGVKAAEDNLLLASNPFFTMSRELWGVGWTVVVLALLNSSLAASAAGQNAGARVIFALGRAGVLPRLLGHVHERYRTPAAAITAQTILNVMVSLVLGNWLGPIGALGFIGLLVAIGTIIVYMLANMAVIPLYRGPLVAEWSVLHHGVAPVLGTILLAVALYYTVWPIPPRPLAFAEGFVGLWLAIGVVLAGYLGSKRDSALARAAEIFSESPTVPSEELLSRADL